MRKTVLKELNCHFNGSLILRRMIRACELQSAF